MTARYLLDYDLEADKYDEFLKMFEELHALEASQEKKNDPRQFVNILSSLIFPFSFALF